MSPAVQAALKRLGITFLISVVFAYGVAELSFQSVKNQTDNTPHQTVIVIPPGTAADIAQGKPGPALPDLRFAEGDQIIVKNMDAVSHQLGPLWVPPNTSSVLTLDRPNGYSLDSSFEPTKSIQVQVIPRATTSDRVLGILSIGLPTWILLWLYSLIAVKMPTGIKPSPVK